MLKTKKSKEKRDELWKSKMFCLHYLVVCLILIEKAEIKETVKRYIKKNKTTGLIVKYSGSE